MLIQAPHPAPDVTMVMPNPELDNEQRSRDEIVLQRTATGETRSYKKATSQKDLVLTWVLTADKYREVREFFKIYRTAKLKLTLHDNTIWIGKLNSSVDGSLSGRFTSTQERVELTLEFVAENQ